MLLEEGLRWHSSRKILKFQVLGNAISAVLKQSQRVLISHFLKIVIIIAFKNFKNDCIPLIFFLQVFDVTSCFNLGSSIEPPRGPLPFKVTGNHAKFARFVLLPVSKEAKT